MPRLLLVEDEPSAVRYLRSIIESRCAGFEVIDTAENGSEALEKIGRTLPDVVITDIKMAVMDGIELASRIASGFPFVYTVIVSGYQEFEYARRALNTGVVDYLLKPVNAGQLKRLLESIGKKLAADYYARRVELFMRALAGSPIEPWMLAKYLPFKDFGIAILRSGGLPSRYRTRSLERDLTRVAGRLREELEGNDIWALAGRDSSELLFIHTPALTGADAFKKVIVSLSDSPGDVFHTLLCHSGRLALGDMAAGAAGLYRALDATIVIGRSQVISGSAESRSAPETAAVLDPALGSRLDFLVSNAMYGSLEEELRNLFLSWEKESKPQMWIETYLRQVFQLILKKSPSSGSETGDDFEFLLDDAMHDADTFAELSENAWNLAIKILQCPRAPRQKTDVPALLESMERYLRENYTDSVTLQSVCETFGISQTYLSRLFRRHENKSFNDYLTGVRIEAAKRLMLENPDMPLKDVAVFAGYHDQFYFSRVFKSVTGVTPSEYAHRGPPSGC